jgi:hypothetical protein
MRLLLLLICLLIPLGARAQSTASVVATCGTPNITYSPGASLPITVDTTGALCGSSGGGGTTYVPSTQPALTPVVTGALAASLVLKASAGKLFSVYASNLTGAGAGFLLVLNATSKPGDGASTPIVCVPFSGGVAQAAYINIPPAAFATGITAVVSTATTCFTQTSSVATAFISGMVN